MTITVKAKTTKEGHFTVTLLEAEGRCDETVIRNGALVHSASFDALCLGEASRSVYVSVMLDSIIERYRRTRP